MSRVISKLKITNQLRLLLPVLLCCFSLLSYAQDDAVLEIPVRVYVINSEEVPRLDAEINQMELEDLFEVVNLIWEQANIAFVLDTVIERPSVAQGRYILAANQNSELTDRERRMAMSEVCAIPGWANTVLNLCIVGQMPNVSSGGTTYRYNNHFPLVVWPVDINAKRYLNPATLAHEFGHFLSLVHSKDPDIYLMRGSGNNMRRIGNYDRIKFNESEISAARGTAKQLLSTGGLN